MLHIFIDTGILFSDPFWESTYAKQLKKAALDGKVFIYLSSVVIMELRRNFEKNIDKEIFDIKKVNQNLSKLIRNFSQYSIPDKEKLLKEFDTFYKVIGKKTCHQIIELKNDFLPTILEKAIYRKKPFTESKSELKDALIWQSYVDYIKNQKLNNCIFLTTNHNDFCDLEKIKNKIYEIHDDLKMECDKFTVYTSINSFMKDNYELLYKPELEFEAWIKSENIDSNYVHDLLWENFIVDVADELQFLIEKQDPSTLFKDKELSLLGGYLSFNHVSWGNCSDIKVDLNSDYAIVTGRLNISCNIEAYGYNSVRDEDDEKYPFMGEDDFEFELLFSFILKKDDEVEDFEVTDIEIK